MIVYLSGPMRGLPLDNWPAFIAGARRLRAAGYEVLSPAEHTMEMGYDPRTQDRPAAFDLRTALLWDCAAVLRSDAVVLLDGWTRSLGCKAEIALAEAVAIRVVALSVALTHPPDVAGADVTPDPAAPATTTT